MCSSAASLHLLMLGRTVPAVKLDARCWISYVVTLKSTVPCSEAFMLFTDPSSDAQGIVGSFRTINSSGSLKPVSSYQGPTRTGAP